MRTSRIWPLAASPGFHLFLWFIAKVQPYTNPSGTPVFSLCLSPSLSLFSSLGPLHCSLCLEDIPVFLFYLGLAKSEPLDIPHIGKPSYSPKSSQGLFSLFPQWTMHLLLWLLKTIMWLLIFCCCYMPPNHVLLDFKLHESKYDIHICLPSFSQQSSPSKRWSTNVYWRSEQVTMNVHRTVFQWHPVGWRKHKSVFPGLLRLLGSESQSVSFSWTPKGL